PGPPSPSFVPCRCPGPHPSLSLFPLLIPRPPISTLFPYTTLFRSAIIRLLVATIVLLNQILVAYGWSPLPFSEEEIYEGLSALRSEEHTSELQSRENLVCRLLLEKKKVYSDRGHVTHRRPVPR